MMRFALLIAITFVGAGCHAESEPSEPTYAAAFAAAIEADGEITVSIRISQDAPVLRELDFDMPEPLYTPEPSEQWQREGNRIVWRIPPAGGELRYVVNGGAIAHDSKQFYQGDDGVIGRLERLFPAATARTLAGAQSASTLQITHPDWGFESRYGQLAGDKAVDIPILRNFNRPTGWFLGGEIGTRRTVVADRRVAVSALTEYDARRMDTLAFLRWTLPELVQLLPGFPERVLVVFGQPDMWRGGLSGPNSIYLHPGRPLISENGTSTLLHELLHVGGLHSAAEGDDWIVEGLAEYYSVELLRRSGAISEARFAQTIDTLSAWVAEQDGKLSSPSKGVDTAAAVLMLNALAAELADQGGSLDEVLRSMASIEAPNRNKLIDAVEGQLGAQSSTLAQWKIERRDD